MTGNADVATRLSLAVKLAISGDGDSPALGAAIEALKSAIATAGPWVVSIDEDELLVNGSPVTFDDDLEGAEYSRMLREVFDDVGIARLVFAEAVDTEELGELFRTLRSDYRAAMPGGFANRRLTRILVDAGTPLRTRARAVVSAWLALRADLAALRDARDAAAETGALRSALRRLHRLMDLPAPMHPVRTALAMRGAESGPDHASGVAMIAMLSGAAAGARRAALSRLGVAGILHGLHGHDDRATSAGLAAALRFAPSEATAMAAALLPCANAFPDAGGALVSAACEIHRLLATRGPDEAYQLALTSAGERRQLAVRLLGRTLGTFPPGTAVQLSRGERAVVIRPSRDPGAADRPIVRVLREGDAAVDYLADLSDKGSLRRVARGASPAQAGFDPLREFLRTWGVCA